jgi:hypothetical protein
MTAEDVDIGFERYGGAKAARIEIIDDGPIRRYFPAPLHDDNL